MGGALEFYDFIIFIFFAPTIGRVFFPADMPVWLVSLQTYGIFAVGYIVRPLGGLALAHFGDLFGRKRVFAFSIMLMALSTLGIGLLPSYAQVGSAAPILLLLMRALQGAAIGGEVPGAWTFVSEHVPSRRVGLACGLVSAGLALGILVGSLIAALVSLFFTQDQIVSFAWRIPFFIGAFFGILAVFLRQWLNETPVFLGMRANSLLIAEMPLKVVLRNHARGIILSVLVTWIMSASVVVTALMTPALLENYHGYTAQQSLVSTCIVTTFLLLGACSTGAVVDRVPIGTYFIFAGAVFGLSTYVFHALAGNSLHHLYFFSALMGFSASIAAAPAYVMVKSFPAHVRFTGVSFAFNISYAFFGGITPLGLALLMPLNAMASSYYLLFIAALSIGLGAYLVRHPDSLTCRVGFEDHHGEPL
jgi:predicted MFS family arabinose efflux permease